MQPPGSAPVVRSAGGSLAMAAALLVGAALIAGCGGSPTAPERDEVFYLHGGGVIDRSYSWEVYFPPLNRDETPRVPRLVGVGVLDGDVRMSRPLDWSIRNADYTPGARVISYQSPRQFTFSIYERIDHPWDPWTDVLDRFEADAKEQGAQILASRLPASTANAQARTYILRTPARTKPPFLVTSHEILVRSDKRVLLVQVVHSDDTEAIADEVAAVVRSMLVY